MGRRAGGTPAPAVEPGAKIVRRRVVAGFVAQPAGVRAGFVGVKGATAKAELGELVDPVVGVLVFEPQQLGVGSSFLDVDARVRWGMLELLLASKPALPLDREGYFEERDGRTYVQAVELQTPVYAWVNEHFPGARWGGLIRWDLAFAVQNKRVVAVIGGMVPAGGAS